jgi:hypothetical protein
MATRDANWTASELAFLDDIACEKAPRAIKDRLYDLTTRQIEWLVDLRDGTKDHAKTENGLSVARLIEQCWLNRHGLDSDEHIDFIERIHGRTTLKARQLGLLLHIARKLHEIEEYA